MTGASEIAGGTVASHNSVARGANFILLTVTLFERISHANVRFVVPIVSCLRWMREAQEGSRGAASRASYSVSLESPIACHAEAVCEGRSILLRWLRFRRGFLSFAWAFPSLWSGTSTNSTDFVLLFGSGRGALATFLAELLF